MSDQILNRVDIFNQPAVGSGTAIVSAGSINATVSGANFVPKFGDGAFRVTVGLSTSAVFNLQATDGSTTHEWAFNGGTALGAEELFTFTWGHSGSGGNLSYNFTATSGNPVVEFLQVEEIGGGVL